MPVTSSAKKALRVSERRHTENLIRKGAYKRAMKATRKAADESSNALELFQKAQSTLDKAAAGKTIHPNKAARLKSRLFKKITAAAATAPTTEKKPAATKATAKKATATKKTTAKKPAAKKA